MPVPSFQQLQGIAAGANRKTLETVTIDFIRKTK